MPAVGLNEWFTLYTPWIYMKLLFVIVLIINQSWCLFTVVTCLSEISKHFEIFTLHYIYTWELYIKEMLVV